MTEKQELLDLADEIEQSDGIVLMLTGYTRQIGIRRTASVIAALRAAAPSHHPRREEPVAWWCEFDGHIDTTIYIDTAQRWETDFKRKVIPLVFAAEPLRRMDLDGAANTDQPIFDAIAMATYIDAEPDGHSRIVISAARFIKAFNNHRDRATCTSLAAPPPAGADAVRAATIEECAKIAETTSGIRQSRSRAIASAIRALLPAPQPQEKPE